MNFNRVLIILSLFMVNYMAITEAKCGMADLMKNGKEMQAKAESMCKNGHKPTAEQMAKAKQCAQAEAGKAHNDYKKYIEEAMNCKSDHMWNDPCGAAASKEGKACADKLMKDHPKIKQEAMGWVKKHCDDFKNHMSSFSKCAGF